MKNRNRSTDLAKLPKREAVDTRKIYYVNTAAGGTLDKTFNSIEEVREHKSYIKLAKHNINAKYKVMASYVRNLIRG